MRYRLITQPTVGPGKVTEELERLLKHAKRLTTSLVVVGPPHKRVPMTATVLEVPDQSAPMAMRVLEVMLGPSGNCEPQKAITARAEWLKHALLEPQKGAQPLVETLFEGWSSACLHVHWRPGRCVGVIHYSEGDAARVAALAAHGWKARMLPANVVDVLAMVRLGISWMGRVSHQPFLGKPLVTPTAQSVIAVTSGGKSMTPASLFSGHQESVFQPDSMGGPKHVTLGQTRPTGIGTVLAPRGDDGFPLGTTLDGQAVKLAWHALLLAVVAPEDRQRDMVRTLVTRAMEHDLGLIAVIPQSLVSTRQLAAWSARVRVLDPRNMWESHAIPWHMIDPLLLREALAAAGVDSAPTLPLPTTLGEFLSTVPGGEQYCTESVLALTAPEGDDLRSVVDAGGGVLLIDDASPSGRLLGMLLFALMAANPQIERRMLLIRSFQIPVPAALARRSIQVVFGEDAAALGTLRAAGDSWRLTHADGSPATDLDADLDRPSSALDVHSYETLMDALMGEQTGSQITPLPAALPVSAITDTEGAEIWADDAGELFATPSLPVAPTDNHGLFSFDSAPDAPAPAPIHPAPADGSSFRSFFDFPLDGGLAGAAAVPAADWMAPGAVADSSSAAPDDQRGGEFALPDMVETGMGDAFTDFMGQAIDELAAPAPSPAADVDTAAGSSDVRNQPADDHDELLFDLFAAPLDFGGVPATTHGDAAAAFGAGTDMLGTGSIFPLCTVDPNVLIIPPDLQDWKGELGAAPIWASDVPAPPGPLDEVDTTAGTAVGPSSAALTVAEIPASAHHVHARRRRRWTPSRRVTIALPDLPDTVELPAAAVVADDTVLPLDAMTLALTTGDLDLTSAALFEGADFALPPAAADATGEPLLEPTPGDVLLDFLGDPMERLAGQPTAAEAPAPVERAAVDDTPDLLDLAGLNVAVEQVAPSATAASLPSVAADGSDFRRPVEEPGAIMVPIALVPAVEPALSALNTLAGGMTVPQRAGADLTFDAAAIQAAWGGGMGMAELVDLVARQNPGADRSLIRRTIRALLDARSAAGTAGSTLSATQLWNIRAPSNSAAGADTVEALDAVHVPRGPDLPLDMALRSPQAPNLTLDTCTDSGTLEAAPAVAAPIPDLPAVLAFVAPPEQTVQLDVAAGVADSVAAPASDDNSLSDDAVWARWSNGVELVEIIRVISGSTRGRAADQARERVDRVVVPRIVVALDADRLVTRLIAGRNPLPSQTSLFEALLRQLNRQSGQVTGVIREKTIARLLASMREARTPISAVA